MSHPIIDIIDKQNAKEQVPSFRVGDTVNVHVKISEGDKQRIQLFNGVVIARRGKGMSEMFTVRRTVGSEGVERVFPLHSPHIAKVEVIRSGKVRRAKLYFLRDRVGKARRLRDKRVGKSDRAATAKQGSGDGKAHKHESEQPELATVES